MTPPLRSHLPSRSRAVAAGLALILFTLGCSASHAADEPPAAVKKPSFPGWQGLRVIEQEGYPRRMMADDLNADGKSELLVVNPRLARIEIYRYRPTPDEEQAKPRSDRPNELPMAPDIERIEVGLENLPVDVATHDLDGDGKAELIVLVTMPNRVEVYRTREGLDDYEKARSIDLLEGDYAGRDALMLIDTSREPPMLMISMAQGIQRVTLSLDDDEEKQAELRPTWLEPKQAINRAGWWLGDLDGDGDTDLIEWTTDADRSLRWMQRVDGRLMPPQTLHDQLVNQAVVFRGSSGAAEIALLGGVQSGVLRHYRLGRDEEGPVGGRQTLALDATDKTPWTAVTIDGQPTLLKVDSDQPRLSTYTLTEGGWQAGQTYPLITGVEQIVAAPGKPGQALMRTKESGRLYVTYWDGERFVYPTVLDLESLDNEASKDEERAILNLGQVGPITWWTQRIGKDVVLCRLQAGAELPQITRFEKLGDKVKEAVWLGGDRLLVNDQYARQPRLVTRVDGEVKSDESAYLKAIKADQLQLFMIDDAVVLGRLTEGVLQWLDDAMQPTDQVMLPEGARLASFVPLAGGEAWALQAGGKKVHRLKPDDAGILRVTRTYRLPGGQRLAHHPALGLLLIDRDAITRLSEGASHKLELAQSIDSREGRPSGVREATIHRIFADDVTGAGHEQLILADDLRHQLTLLDAVTPETDHAEADPDAPPPLKGVLSWPVFEDSKYPYGYHDASMGGEPRRIIALDLDGDGRRDLALLSHDRLILYLGENK